jgi:hypothetical protein
MPTLDAEVEAIRAFMATVPPMRPGTNIEELALPSHPLRHAPSPPITVIQAPQLPSQSPRVQHRRRIKDWLKAKLKVLSRQRVYKALEERTREETYEKILLEGESGKY